MDENDQRNDSGLDRRKFLAGLGTGVAASVAGCGQQDGGQSPTGTQTGTAEGTEMGTPTPTASGGPGGDTPTDTETPTDTPTGQIQEGGKPTIGMAVAPDTLNPLKAGSVYSFYIIDRVMLYGTKVHPKTTEFKPWAITDWTLNPGNVGTNKPTLANVTLRDDLKFHDGKQVTADDLKFTINYIKEQKPTGSLNANAHKKVTKVDKTGDFTVDIYMKGKDQRWFTNILGYPILPEHIWSGVDDFTKYSPRKADEGLVGAGAFKLKDFNWQNWYELELADDWTIPQADYADWFAEGAPFVDGIRFEVFGSQNAMEQAVLNGDITSGFVAGGFTVNSAIKAKKSDQLNVQKAQEAGYNHISYNMRRVPFDDVAFRQFLNKSFDKQWVIAEPYNDIGAVKGDYAVIPALKRWRPPAPQKLANKGSFSAGGVASEDLNVSEIQSDQTFPDLSFPGSPGTFNMNMKEIKKVRNFLMNHDQAKHDYSFGKAKTNITTAPDGKELYVNGKHLTEAHTNNAGEGGQGPLVFSFQPPQEDLYQARYGQRFNGLLKKIGIPVEPKVKTINAQIPTIYVKEDFDFYAMGWGLGVNATHFSSLYSSQGADLKGNVGTGKFNPMAYTGADTLIARDRKFMDFSKRTPYVRQICAEIYRDAPTNITDVARLLEPTNKKWKGWISGLGTTISDDSFLNIHQTK